MDFPLTPLAWLQAPALFAHPADGLAQLHPENFTEEEPHGPHKDQRLGRQFEDLICYQLAQQPHLRLVHRNLALRQGGRTLGELDALLYHLPTRAYWHWEFTFKHYLGVRKAYWPGPNPKDHFHRKYHHGLAHQFPLMRSSVAQAQLPGPVAQQHLISRGILYYPAHEQLPPPQGAASGHLRGLWYSEATLPRHRQYLILPKPYWLHAQRLLDKTAQWHSAAFVIRTLHQVNSPLLILVKCTTGGLLPAFVVPNQWLNHVYREEDSTPIG